MCISQFVRYASESPKLCFGVKNPRHAFADRQEKERKWKEGKQISL